MKKIKFIGILFLIAFSICFSKGNSQSPHFQHSNLQNKDTATVYWFYIKVKLDRRIKEYKLLVKSPILSGSLEKFDKDLWWNLQGGQLLVVGPFETEKEAVTSNQVYLLVAKDENLDILKEKVVMHWFKLKYAISKRKHSFILEAIHEVFSGTYLDFYFDIKHGLKEGNIPIGPYKDYEYVKEMTEPRKTDCGM